MDEEPIVHSSLYETADEMNAQTDESDVQIDDDEYSFLDRTKSLVNRKRFSDVGFLVGEQKKLIHGIRAILSFASPVFEK